MRGYWNGVRRRINNDPNLPRPVLAYLTVWFLYFLLILASGADFWG